MTKEIYEKKHRFEAVIDAVYMLVGFGFVLFMMIMMPTFKNSAFESEWIRIALIVVMELLGVIVLILAPRNIWTRYSRYIDLCIARRPAVIIGDDKLQFYSSTDEYKCYRWDEIECFKYAHSRMYSTIQPVLKESWRNPKWYVWLFAFCTHAIRTDYLDMPEDELLNELNAHLR
jgi:hypothetical protein